ncbi:hypothetical protein BJX64DRAFT_289737 [Aspergillus heterothallicus]
MATKPFDPVKYFKLHHKTDQESDSSPESTQPRAWRPFYLQRRILAAFAVAFCGIIAALEVLRHVSQANYGIASSVKSRHYAWTYAPTAIFTVAALLWARVAFQAKQHAPWQAMRVPVEADKSVLLDYISPFQPVAIWKSMRNQHYMVAAASTCSILFSLIIVFSTGLFTLKQIAVPKTGVPIVLYDYFSNQDPDFQAEGATPFDIINSVIFHNGTYPGGTTADLAYQQFSAPNVSSEAIVIAPIGGIGAQLGCETASLTVQKWDWVQDVNSSSGLGSAEDPALEIATSSCTIANFSFPAMASYMADFAEYQCAGLVGASDSMRFVVAAAQISKGTQTADNTWDVVVDRSVALICKPTYSLLHLQAQTNVSDSSDIQFNSMTVENTTLPGLAPWNITASLLDDWVADGTPTEASMPETFTAPNETNEFGTDTSINYWIKIGAWLAGKTGSVDLLFEDGMLDNMASSFYRAIAAQYVHTGLVRQNSSTVIGSAIENENRVVMTQLALRILEACLAVAVVLCVAMIVWASPSSSATSPPWNPNTISGTAAIVASSPDLCAVLSGTSATSLARVSKLIQTPRFYTAQSSAGVSIETSQPAQARTEATDASNSLENDDSIATDESKFPGTLIFRLGLILAVGAIIAALEIILHVSKTNDGLAYVSTNGYLHYSWTVVPSLIMQCIGLGFASISFDIRLLAPYARVKSGAAFEDFMTLNFLDSLDIAVIWISARKKYFAVLTITLATFLAPFLSVITSGLFNAVEVPQYIKTTVVQQDSFTRLSGRTSNGNEADINDFAIAGYILEENITFPQWTYETLAFPKLSIPALAGEDLAADSFVDLSVPVLRPAPTCSLLTGSEVNYTIHKTNPVNNKTTYYLKINFPTVRCAPWSIDEASTVDNDPTEAPINDNEYFGNSLESTCSRANASSPMSYYWGELRNGSVANIAAMSCTGTAERLNARSRFHLPSFNLSTDYPPVADESSATSAGDDTWVPAGWFASYFGPDVGPQNLDSFFQALVTGKWGIPKEYLGDVARNNDVAGAVKFQDSIIKTQLYSRVDRAAIDSSSSTTLDNNNSNQSVSGTVFLNNRIRLYQDVISTRVLEGFLGGMLLLGILASMVFTNHRRILPKAPSSIAAAACLLADSNFLDWYRSAEDLERENGTKERAQTEFVASKEAAYIV